MTRDTILFDINETVLDLSSLKPLFKEAFGDERFMTLWFSMLLHSSTVCALTNRKSDFKTLAATMLESLSARQNVTLSPTHKDNILAGFASLPPHIDIKEALSSMRAAGYQTVAFTNSSLSLVTAQITHAGLLNDFDHIVSVEQTGSFKPDPKVYQFVASTLNKSIETLRLVATHDWDTNGAMAAGMQAAYIDRSGAPYHPLYLKPDIIEKDMRDVVKRIIEVDGNP